MSQAWSQDQNCVHMRLDKTAGTYEAVYQTHEEHYYTKLTGDLGTL